MRLKGHSNLFSKMKFERNLSIQHVYWFVYKLQMTFVIHLPV